MDELERVAREAVQVWFLFHWSRCVRFTPDGRVVRIVTEQELSEMLREDLIDMGKGGEN